MELRAPPAAWRDRVVAGLVPVHPPDYGLRPGPRDGATARLLWSRIPPVYCQGPLRTDYWESVHKVLPVTQHRAAYSNGPIHHIERFNNTLRQRLGRFVRKTLSFSKSIQMHEIAIRLFWYQYNLAHSLR